MADFLLLYYIELNSASAKPRFFGATKQYVCVIIILLHPWITAVFADLEAEEQECWQTRGRLLNSWNGYQKLAYLYLLAYNVQAGIFVAEHEKWIKMTEYLLNTRLIKWNIRLQNML